MSMTSLALDRDFASLLDRDAFQVSMPRAEDEPPPEEWLATLARLILIDPHRSPERAATADRSADRRDRSDHERAAQRHLACAGFSDPGGVVARPFDVGARGRSGCRREGQGAEHQQARTGANHT